MHKNDIISIVVGICVFSTIVAYVVGLVQGHSEGIERIMLGNGYKKVTAMVWKNDKETIYLEYNPKTNIYEWINLP